MFLLLIKTFLCIWQILHLIHFICDKRMETPCERHYREQKVSDLTSMLVIPSRLQAATLDSRWQASIVNLEQAYQFSFRLWLHRFSLWGCHVMNERLKPEDSRDELINSLSGSRLFHTYSVCRAFAVRIFFRTHVNGPVVRSRSGASAAVQRSFPHRVYFCCAARAELKWPRFVRGKN